MDQPLPPPPRPRDLDQSPAEEFASSVSHGVALVLALAGAMLLVNDARHHGDGFRLAGTLAFGFGMAAVYLTSMLYHAFPHHGKAKRLFLILDHDAIYLLIAGSYTPFALGALRSPLGWTMLALVWGLGAAGILAKSILGPRAVRFSTGLYVAMGWIGLPFGKLFYDGLSAAGLWWLLAGGLAYTAGVPFFLLEGRMRFSHFVWHLFVMGGTACHFVAVWKYAG